LWFDYKNKNLKNYSGEYNLQLVSPEPKLFPSIHIFRYNIRISHYETPKDSSNFEQCKKKLRNRVKMKKIGGKDKSRWQLDLLDGISLLSLTSIALRCQYRNIDKMLRSVPFLLGIKISVMHQKRR